MTSSHSASTSSASLARLSDRDLLRALHQLTARDREVEAELLAHLGEVDARGLYLEEGCASMFAYCTEVLHFSEATARAYPLVLDHLRRGELHLSGVKLLAPHLTRENHAELLERARHQSKRAIEAWLADRTPKPDAASVVRQLPQRKPTAGAPLAATDSGSSRPLTEPARAADSGTPAPLRAAPIPPSPATRPPSPAPQPLGQERFKIQFTASRALCQKLREAQALLRHQVPSGDLCPAPRNRSKQDERKPASRHIPAEVKRAVAARDRGRCAFVGRSGRRCGSRDFVEFHHKEPWAKSKLHPVEGIELRCRAHNHYAAVQDYGAGHMERCRGSGRRNMQSRTRAGASSAGASPDPRLGSG
jgi:hypothetical protein